MEDQVEFKLGDALAMPFADESFDGAYSMNVSMNIADKSAFYKEIRRVLKPGGWLVLSEIAKGEGAEPDYPTPWAASAQTSFLSAPEETRRGLAEAGFEVLRLQSTLEQARAFGARSRAMVERGEKPPFRAIMLIHGELAKQMMANMSRSLSEARINPIEVLSRKR
jgi:ubiquinone/menaquinone biosynthesis C-methylase UbiE